VSDWWNEISIYDKSLFVIGSIFTVFMFVNLVLLFLGNDGDGNIDEISHDSGVEIFGLKLLTVRSMAAFVSVGAWSTYIFNMADIQPVISTLIGMALGLCASLAVAIMMNAMSKLQSSGNLNYKSTVGKNAEVYLTIPANRRGIGKVSVYMEDRFLECEAVTSSDLELKTGTQVKVIGLYGENILNVENLLE
jgi:hypothetical protein